MIKVALITLSILFIIQILVSVAFSSVGRTIRELEERAISLSLQNQQLGEQIASSQALVNIASGAAELGFVPSPLLYLSREVSLKEANQ